MRRHDLAKKDPPTYLPTYLPPFENTLKEWSLRLVTFETFNQSYEETWSTQQKDNDKDNDNEKYKDKDT